MLQKQELKFVGNDNKFIKNRSAVKLRFVLLNRKCVYNKKIPAQLLTRGILNAVITRPWVVSQLRHSLFPCSFFLS